MLWALWFALAAAPEPPALRLRLEPGLRCGLETTLPGALAQQQVRLSAEHAWTLSVRNESEGLLLQLTNEDGVLRGERRLMPSSSDCPVLPRTAALLVRSWLTSQLAAPVAEIPKLAAMPSPRLLRGGFGPLKKPVEPQPAELPPIAPPLVAAEVAPVEPEAAEPESEPADFFFALQGHLKPRSTRSLSVIATGGGAVALSDTPVGFGRLAVEWGIAEPWGIELDAGAQTSRTNAGGMATALLQWAALGARRGFFTHGLDGLHVGLAVQAIRMSASSFGFSSTKQADVFLPGVEASLDWRVTSNGGLFVIARIAAQARQPQQFLVNGIGKPVLEIPWWGVGAEVGVGFNFL
jgi:hypothetical protein